MRSNTGRANAADEVSDRGAHMEASMRRRLYFILPDVLSAKQVVDDLLLARIEAGHIHILAPRDAQIGDLPEATVFQKTDLVHGGQIGALIGGLLGAIGGALLVTFPPGTMRLQ